MDKDSGQEILKDPILNTSNIGQLFYSKFKMANCEMIASVICWNWILCSLKVGGK